MIISGIFNFKEELTSILNVIEHLERTDESDEPSIEKMFNHIVKVRLLILNSLIPTDDAGHLKEMLVCMFQYAICFDKKCLDKAKDICKSVLEHIELEIQKTSDEICSLKSEHLVTLLQKCHPAAAIRDLVGKEIISRIKGKDSYIANRLDKYINESVDRIKRKRKETHPKVTGDSYQRLQDSMTIGDSYQCLYDSITVSTLNEVQYHLTRIKRGKE